MNLVLPKETQVSEKQVVSEDMPENRENQTGHGTFEDVESEGGTLDSVLLGGYIQEHFADFLDEPKGGSLDYGSGIYSGWQAKWTGRIWKRLRTN